MTEHPSSAAAPGGASAELDPVASPAAPLLRPGPGLRLLAAVVLAILVGGVVGGAAAWAIYQHYGPVERNVYQQITGSSGSQAQTVGQLAQANAASVVTIATQPVTPGDLAAGTASLVDGVIVSGLASKAARVKRAKSATEVADAKLIPQLPAVMLPLLSYSNVTARRPSLIVKV